MTIARVVAVLIIMLSATARAFSMHAASTRRPFLGLVARTMSTTDDNTVVATCTRKIQEALATTNVKVTGAYDDPNGSHIKIEVVSTMFEGKRAMQRQQLVYKAIWEEMQGAVHAVDSMVCKTPDEA